MILHFPKHDILLLHSADNIDRARYIFQQRIARENDDNRDQPKSF